jgi:hypothetical protein
LRAILWAEERNGGQLTAWLGRIGFALFALALFIGMFTSAASATSYVQTQGENARQAIALDYAGHYALETLLSRILGGICLTVFLILVSLRMTRMRRFPLWFGVVGVLCTALQATTAVFFAFGPTQATVPTAVLAIIALALWLLIAGVFLFRTRALPTIDVPASAVTP